MSDVADDAQVIESVYLKVSISSASIKSQYVVSAEICEECGDVIPEARRNAVPGCRLCCACQEEADA